MTHNWAIKQLGPYEILTPLGSGGMGEVYRARDPRINREVAIKLLPSMWSGDSERLRRFEQEVRAAGSINHPNLISVFDTGSDNGSPYLVMELLDGGTLRDRMDDGIPQRKAIEYAVQIANGLAAAHEKGIIHRDLKPENIFITRDGRVKILDFGLAKLSVARAPVPETHTVARGTSPGTVVGTTSYMSPEQVRGEELDFRTDIFSFGAILYEMLAGRRAFDGKSTADIMSAILREDPPEFDSALRTPPALQHIVRHCLEKHREERFQSARDIAFDLQTISGTSGSVQPTRDTRKWNRIAWLLIAIGALLSTAEVAYRVGHRAVAGAATAALNYHVTQLTFQSGVESFPSIAPDGKTFIYVSNASGNADIYLQRIDGRNAINLTTDSPADDTQPAFSPDGSLIAFRSERNGGGIFVMGATGESVRQISNFGFNPAWSPDAKSIVCGTEPVVFSPQARAVNSELWIIDVATGAKRRLTNDNRPVQPSWSPHGNRIAYWGLTGSQRDLFTIDALQPGAKAKPLTNDAPLDWNPIWSHDGKFIYFGSDRGGAMSLWRIGIDEKSGDALGEPEQIPVPSRFAAHFSIAQDDRHIVFSALEMASAIRRAPLGETKGTNLLSGSMLIFSFDISPDGQWIAFSNSGLQEDLYISRIDGTDLRQITNDAPRDRAPTWTPDGKQLLFYSTRAGGYEIFRINVDGSGLTQVTRKLSEQLWFPRMSPDGTKITATDFDGGYLLPLTNGFATSAESFPLPPVRDRRFVPWSWSPDSRKIAGVLVRTSDREPDGGVYIYDLPSKSYRKIRDSGARVRWLPDARQVVIQDGAALYITDVNTGRARAFPFPQHNTIVTKWADPLWSDGKSVCWVEQLNEADIWLVTLDDNPPH